MDTLITQKIFYNYLRTDNYYFTLVKYRFFDNKDIQECYKVDLEFFDRYKNIPSTEQIKTILFQKKTENFLLKDEDTDEILFNDSKLEKIFDIDVTEYDDVWIKENFEAWIQYKNLDSSLFDSISYLKTKKVTIDNVKSIVEDVKEIILQQNNLAFDFKEGLDFFNADSHIQDVNSTFTSGYSWLDSMLGGGFTEKSLHVLMGRMKIGKSIWLSNLAINAVKNGYNAALITLEMSDKKFLKRLGSNMFNVTMDSYDEWSKDIINVKKALKIAKKMDDETLKIPGNLYIKEYPTSSAGVPEIETYLKKMQEIKGIKFKLVVIDYINIMKNWRNPNSENLYVKIKHIAEDVRAMAIRNEWVIVSATQIGRESFKSNDLDMSDISESVGLIATVDSLFGIIQDRMDVQNSQYQLKAIALRDSQGIGNIKKFNIDYSHMRIWEDFTDISMNIDTFMD